jgi:hypothetical protein
LGGLLNRKVEIMSEYVPFGDEWVKEAMKLPKKILVAMLKNSLVANLRHEAAQQSVQADGAKSSAKVEKCKHGFVRAYCSECQPRR